jgi:hypothetical protein
VVRVPGYRFRGPGFDSRALQKNATLSCPSTLTLSHPSTLVTTPCTISVSILTITTPLNPVHLVKPFDSSDTGCIEFLIPQSFWSSPHNILLPAPLSVFPARPHRFVFSCRYLWPVSVFQVCVLLQILVACKCVSGLCSPADTRGL